jgi:nonsense-mediated mRNA decay protein 3
MAGAFCVVCGRTDVPIEEGVCADCYAKHHPLVTAREQATVVLCPTCGARKVGRHWEGQGRTSLLGAEDLMPFLVPHPEVAIRRVEWTDESVHPLLRTIEGVVSVRFRGKERQELVRFTVKVVHQTCTDCSRKTGHFYTALIQLRASEEAGREKPAERRARLLRRWEEGMKDARAEWRHALSWYEERPEGLDFYLTDTTAAKALARWLKSRLAATLKESATLYGRKDGHDVYRVTFCLRVPDDPPGRSAVLAAPSGTGPVEGRGRVERQP